MANGREIRLMKIAINEYLNKVVYETVSALVTTLFLLTVYTFTEKVMVVFLAGMSTVWWLYSIVDLYYMQYEIWKIKDVRKIFRMIYGW